MPTTPTFLTRAIRFAAAHRYHRPEWSEEENRRVFGACANEHGHGHNYVLEVTVRGEPDRQTGFAVDLMELDGILEREVRERLDHRHLNHAVDEFAPGRSIPTTENLVIHLWDRIAGALPQPATLVRLRLREDVDLWVDYYGPGRAGGEPGGRGPVEI